MEWLGLRSQALLNAILLPTLATVGLFAGPIAQTVVDGSCHSMIYTPSIYMHMCLFYSWTRFQTEILFSCLMYINEESA